MLPSLGKMDKASPLPLRYGLSLLAWAGNRGVGPDFELFEPSITGLVLQLQFSDDVDYKMFF
jgi:hypothetical protein